MSFFKKIFNRKEQAPVEKQQERHQILTEEEEEDIEKLSEEGTFFRNKIQEDMVISQGEEEEFEVVEREILPAKIICPDCGGITLEGLDFCDKCGGELL